MWNEHEHDGVNHYNGEYRLATGTSNDNSYWIKTPGSANCSSNDYIMYVTDPQRDRWMMDTQLSETYINRHSYCKSTPLWPSDCAAGWEYLNGAATAVELAITVTAGSCPSLECNAINLQNTGIPECNGKFTRNALMDNVFRNGVRSYFYFNRHTFKWYCSDSLGIDDCDEDTITHYHISSKNDGWKDLEIGSSINLTLDNDLIATLECTGPTPSPSQHTSKVPTAITSNPTTMQPTIHSQNPTLNPSRSPLFPTPSPSISSRINCGANEYCYNIDLFPESQQQTSQIVGVYSTVASQVQQHHITFTSRFHECLDPHLSVSSEQIDFTGPAYGDYFDVFDENSNLIRRCIGDYTSAICGVWNSCIDSVSVGIGAIAVNDTYTITIITGDGFSARCSTNNYHTHSYTLNVAINLICSSTAAPVLSPSISCGSNRWCYYTSLSPIAGLFTSDSVVIANTYNRIVTYHEIHLQIEDNDCINPSITVLFEDIDYDDVDEYFDVFDNNGSLINRCHGTQDYGCDVWQYCMKNQSLSTHQMDANESYVITIQTSDQLNPTNCGVYGEYSLHVQLTIQCSEQSSSPTFQPTSATTTDPTIGSSIDPTVNLKIERTRADIIDKSSTVETPPPAASGFVYSSILALNEG